MIVRESANSRALLARMVRKKSPAMTKFYIERSLSSESMLPGFHKEAVMKAFFRFLSRLGISFSLNDRLENSCLS